MATLQAIGSGESQTGTPCTVMDCKQAMASNHRDFAAVQSGAQSLLPKSMLVSAGWIPDAPVPYQNADSSGHYQGTRLHAVAAQEVLDNGSGPEGLVSDAAQCAAARVAVKPTLDLLSAFRERSGSDDEDRSTPSGLVNAGSAAAAGPAVPPPPALAVSGTALQLSVLQLQHVVQHQLTPWASSVGCEGTLIDGHHTTDQPPPATVDDVGAVLLGSATNGQQQVREACTRRTYSQGGGLRPARQQQQLEETSNGGGKGSWRSARFQKNRSTTRHKHDMSDEDEDESDPEVDSEGSEEGAPESNAEIEEDDGAINEGSSGDDKEEEEEEEEGQPEEHMPGCHRCCFALVGCSSCRTRPLASRPYARWKPEQARFQEGIPDAPIFYPTPEEFVDPLLYIKKIRPEAEKYGICRIVPPASCWDPRFAMHSSCGGRECFRFEARHQFISHLCIRPCGTNDLQGQDQELERQHIPPGVADQEHVDQDQDSNQMRRVRMSGMEALAGAKSHHIDSKKPNLGFIHQRQSGPHRHWWQVQRQQQQQRQKRHQQDADAVPAIAILPRPGAGGAEQFTGPSGGEQRGCEDQDNPNLSYDGVRLVAPGNCPCKHAPAAVVDESLERYITGLRPHPLLDRDEAAAAEAAAALSAVAAAGAAADGWHTSAAHSLGAGGSAGSSKVASVGRCVHSICRVAQAARAAAAADAAASSGRSGGSDEGWGSESGSDSGGDFVFETSERMHTLRSFQAYCRWAQSLHFDLPPFGDRYRDRDRDKPGMERASSCLPTSSGQTTESNDNSTAIAGANVGLASAALTASALPTRAAAVVVHATSGCEPSVEEIEAEFWRIVERPTAGQVVDALYSTDLDSARYGSGFPLPPWRAPADTRGRSQPDTTAAPASPLDGRAGHYASHPWNINNLPHAKGSVLRYLETKELIPGVTVPWVHVGSCLSAFCWRVEDHALYSMNYLHSGAPKVWYGVPAHAADQFEAAMHDAVPQLFREDPLLLHRLVTHLSPSELQRRGVPVCRLVHKAGSFVITFPSAYHSGFNCGFNCAEAINFAPVDWLPFGSAAIRKYRTQSKRNTISHDSLLVRVVSAAPFVHAARQAAALPYILRPKVEAVEDDAVPGVVEVGLPSSAPFKSKATTAVASAGAAAEVVIATNVCDGDGDGSSHLGCSSQAGIHLAEVPPAAVCIAVGELELRLEEEARRRAVAREFGVTQERSMLNLDSDGMHTCAAATDCALCKCDLFMSAIVTLQRPGVATCPEHAASLGVPPAACVLLTRHSLDDLRAMIDAALELFPEGSAAIAAARLRLASQPVQAIRRLGPVFKYSVPYAALVGGQEARDAVSAAFCAVAGPLKDPMYLPCDPEAVICCDGAAMQEVKQGSAAAATSKAGPMTDVVQRQTATASAVDTPAAMSTPAVAPVAAASLPLTAMMASGSERERLGPRQVKMLEEQIAEVHRREEQQRAKEIMRRARAQRTARRTTAAAGDVQEQLRRPAAAPPESGPPQLALSGFVGVTTLVPPPPQPMLCVPALAVIAPMPIVPSPPPVLTTTEVLVPTLTNVAIPPVSLAAADLNSPTAVSVPVTLLETAVALAPLQAAVMEGSARQGFGALEQVTVAQGAKRSCRVAIDQSLAVSAVESDRVVRPRRERRVPKHLLDTEMELAQEMQQVMGGATAAAAAAAAAAAPPASSPSPASPAAASPCTTAKAAAAKPYGPQPPATSTSTSSSLGQEKDPQPEQTAPPQQSAAKAGGSEADSPAAPGMKLNPTVVAVNLVAAVLGAAVHGTGRLLPGTTRPVPLRPMEQHQHQQQPPQLAQPKPLQPQQHQAEAALGTKLTQLQNQQHNQQVKGSAVACAQNQQQEQKLPSQQGKPQEVQQQPPLHQLLSLQPQPQSHLLIQQGSNPLPPATAPDTDIEVRSAELCAAPLPPLPELPPPSTHVDEIGVSPRRSSRPTRPSVRLLSVGGGAGAGGSVSGPSALAPATTPTATASSTPTMAIAAGAPPAVASAPGVLLLRRETTSGPSTSMRSGSTATRRLSRGLGAAPPGGLPPTSAASPGAPAAAVDASARTASHPTRSAVTGPTALPSGPAAPKVTNATATASGIPCTGKTASIPELGGGQILQLPPPQNKQPTEPPEATVVLKPLPQPASSSGAQSPTRLAVITIPGDTSLHTVSPDIPQLFHPGELALSASADVQPPPQPPPVAIAGVAATQSQPDLSTAGPSPLALPNPVVGGRPVRKRKTTLNHDMVIYGESAALFGQAPGKRKPSCDRRRAAATTTSGSGSGSGAAASAAVGTGSSAADAQPVGANNEASDVADLEDTHDSLATFAMDELRPLVVSMSPPHSLFRELHREATPSSPPLALSMPLAAGLDLHETLAPCGDASAGVVGMSLLGPAGAHDVSVGLTTGGMEMEGNAGTVMPHSPSVYLGLNGDETGQEVDHDMFMAEAADRTLALSASPSASGLYAMAAMMLPPSPCRDSPHVAEGYGMLVHTVGAAPDAPDADLETAPAATTTAPITSGAHARMALQQLQLLGDVMAPCAPVATCFLMESPSSLLTRPPLPGRRAGSGGGGGDGGSGGSTACGDGVASQQMSLRAGQALGAPALTTPATGDSASNLMLTGLVDRDHFGFGEPCSGEDPESILGCFEASRHGLSGFAASTAGEWADLDDIVVL